MLPIYSEGAYVNVAELLVALQTQKQPEPTGRQSRVHQQVTQNVSIESHAPAVSACQAVANAGTRSGLSVQAVRTDARATAELWRKIYEIGCYSPAYT